MNPRLTFGKDIHERSYQVTVRTEIDEHKFVSKPSNPDTLFDYDHRLISQPDIHLSYKASCCGFSSYYEVIPGISNN